MAMTGTDHEALEAIAAEKAELEIAIVELDAWNERARAAVEERRARVDAVTKLGLPTGTAMLYGGTLSMINWGRDMLTDGWGGAVIAMLPIAWALGMGWHRSRTDRALAARIEAATKREGA
jgi:hypothetical protein